MIPLALRIKNFRSFKGEQTFHFPSKPGLYFMQGVNEVEPDLGGNAAGKTTIWDALTWCIFGVTADGLKAGDVCNWDAGKDAMVGFVFMAADGEPMLLRRTWGPISWTLHRGADKESLEEVVIDLAKDGANEFTDMLRLELEPWLMSVLMAQGRQMFLDLKSEAQATLFSEVLGLERWMQYGREMSERARATDNVIRDLERQRSRLEGELDQVNRTDYTAVHDEWEIENAKRVLSLDVEHKRGIAALRELKDAVGVAEKREEAARQVVRDCQPDPKDEEELLALDADIRKMEDQLTRHEVEVAAIEKHMEALREHEECPTCGQEMTGAHIDAECGRARRVLADTEKIVERLIKSLKGLRGKRGNIVGDIRRQEQSLEDAREALRDCERVTAGARRSVELQERELDRIEEEAERLATQENPYAGMARQATRNAAKLREELAAVAGRLEAANERWALQSYWASKGFKEVRLQEIAQALTELEIEVNSAVTALGLIDWELRFAVDKEGKSGGIQRGFTVTVKSPKNPRPTPWKAWSGGEKQRLRLAANMGLADLIRSRTGAALDLEVWDEPTNGLSPEGWADLFDSLASRARHEKRTIFITDHKAHDYGGFDGVVTVIKRPSGSAIRKSW